MKTDRKEPMPSELGFTLTRPSRLARRDGRVELRNGFTLIELLVVMGIVAVLSVVVIYTISPAELLRRARDSNRLSDLNIINKALNLYATDVSSGGSMGNASTTYVSVQDPAATSTAGTNCASLGLPTLPSGWTYHCAASSTYRNVNGQGWIPVNFKSISFGSPLGGALPVDPVNTVSSRNYYTYATGGSWELTASLESSKYKLGGANDKVSTDGGRYAGLYEVGSNLNLEPLDYGDSSLVGYWTFDEGIGSTAYDYSGNNATGSWNGTGTHYAVGKAGNWSGNFNGSDNEVPIPNTGNRLIPAGNGAFTILAWINTNSISSNGNIIASNESYLTSGFRFATDYSGTGKIWFWSLQDGGTLDLRSNSVLSTGTWYFVAMSYAGNSGILYLNGSQVISNDGVVISNTNNVYIGGGYGGMSRWNGYIDDLRIYNRALSAAEISAIYNATK